MDIIFPICMVIMLFILIKLCLGFQLKTRPDDELPSPPDTGEESYSGMDEAAQEKKPVPNRQKVNFKAKQSEIDFIAIDFETATVDRMACQIGITIVRGGKIEETVVRLIQPPGNRYDRNTINVHHITPEMTACQPTFPEIWKELSHLFIGTTIVAHNAAFDEDVLRRNLEYYGLPADGIEMFKCTYLIYNMPLAILCEAFNMDVSGHHDAGFDSKCCAQFYLNYINQVSPDIVISRPKKKKSSYFLADENRKINSETFQPLDDEEVENQDTPFFKKKVVITGVFTSFSRRDDLARLLKNLGADINSTISRKTDIVVIGYNAGPKKLEKIEELQSQGYDIITYEENEMIELFEEHNIEY